MTAIGVLGAGGQAREVADFSSDVVGFFAVDAIHLAVSTAPEGVRLVDLAAPSRDDLAMPVVAAVGAPGVRAELVKRWRGAWTTAVSSDAYLAHDVRPQKGSMIAPGAVLMAGVQVGRHVLVNAGATVGHDTRLDDFATLAPGVRVGGRCRIGRGAFIGIGATVVQDVSIGEGAVVGAGAVVLSDVAANNVAVGVPAQTIRVADRWLREL